jgi:GTP-binding protein
MNAEAITAPTRNVAIVGRPNVGKSALFNRLAGRNIAIVHDQPGITRDRLIAVCNRGAHPFSIWDTGGIGGAGENELASDVREAADAAMRESQLILLVVDAQKGLTPIDEDLARVLRKSKVPIVIVANKIDHPNHDDLAAEFARLGFKTVVPISAAHGRGISELLEAIEERLPTPGDSPPSPAGDGEQRPIALAIVGRPNAGKSSLINSIVQDKRTIVSELPGTTRDAIDIATERAGERYIFIDTAGMRARSKHSTSVEVFSVMRSERTIRRADLCVLVIDATEGVTSQDKRIAGLMQKSHKPAVVVLNKWDLVKPKTRAKAAIDAFIAEARERLFFLDYAPVLVGSALTGENVERLFRMIASVRRAAGVHLGTGPLNRLFRNAFAVNPPPMIGGKRLKLFYAAQAASEGRRTIDPPQFILFVNDPKLLGETYARYLQARFREAQPYPGLPVLLTCRARSEERAEVRSSRRGRKVSADVPKHAGATEV